MTKYEWVLKLRKVTNVNTLDRIIDKKSYELSGAELITFLSAADHRLAEIEMNCYYDKIPKSIWYFIV